LPAGNFERRRALERVTVPKTEAFPQSSGAGHRNCTKTFRGLFGRDIFLGALKSHPKMFFSMKLFKGRYQDLETFDRRKVRKNHLMNCRLAVHIIGVALRGPEFRVDALEMSPTTKEPLERRCPRTPVKISER
jgi:hypothetical protein